MTGFLIHVAAFELVVLVLSDENEKRLIKDILQGYEKRLKPGLNASHPLNVTFGLSLAQLIDVVSKYYRSLN